MKGFLLAITCLILALFAFQSNIAQTRKITKRAAETVAASDADSDQSAIEKVIAQYCRLAKLGKFSQLNKVVVKVPSEEYFTFDENKSPNTKDKSVSNKSKGETPVLSGVSDIYYQFITKDVPQVIFVGQRTFTKVLKTSTYEKKVKTLIGLESGMSNTHFIYMNFYLLKNKQNVWKIYLVKHASNKQVETANED
jgi:hypothetical protein